MKYIEELQKKKVFDLAFAEKLTGNLLSAKSLLSAYKKAGYIISVRRNLYAALDLATKHTLASRFEIGSAINAGAYISFHSALEYHGIANQVFYSVTVCSEERFTSFSYNGVTYEPCKAGISGGVISPLQTPLVRVTDVERTVVDCIYDIDRAGGLEELMESLRLLPGLDEEKLRTYLRSYNQIFLWQKAGFLLEHFRQALRLSPAFFEECKENIHDRKRYLPEAGAMRYYPEWKLYAPANLLGLLEEGDDANV